MGSSHDLVHVSVAELRPGEWLRVDFDQIDDSSPEEFFASDLLFVPSGKKLSEVALIRHFSNSRLISAEDAEKLAQAKDPLFTLEFWVRLREPVVVFDIMVTKGGPLQWFLEGVTLKDAFERDMPELYQWAKRKCKDIGSDWKFTAEEDDAALTCDGDLKKIINETTEDTFVTGTNTRYIYGGGRGAYEANFWAVYLWSDSYDYWGEYDCEFSLQGTLNMGMLAEATVTLKEADRVVPSPLIPA